MHYVINDIIIKSELAAKPLSQTNKYILNYISNLPKEYSVLDYGCGKLRYSIPLAKQVSNVVAVDSTEQINMFQKIGNKICRPRDILMNNLKIRSLGEMDWNKKAFDLIFCTNVFSAIPFEQARLELIQNAKSVIKPAGTFFISVQYRNSYFNTYKTREDVKQYNDGWIIPKKNIFAFYAPITPEYIVELCKKVGFLSFFVTKHDGSCFIEAKL